MDKKKKDFFGAGTNSPAFLTVRLAVSAYLAWLGFDLLRGFLAGTSTLSSAAAWCCGIGFPAVGLGFALYSVLLYRRETKRGESTEETGESR